MPYPSRPSLRPLPQFAGTARSGTTAANGAQVQHEAFVVEQYRLGRSLREIGELADRSQTAIRRVLDKHGVQRRPAGAAVLGRLTPPSA
ncbi:helix-turn-helix domain-containing protein [Geodermatophilus sp. SYSU D00705]